MATTRAADYKFEPKVWSMHAQAYFDELLVYGGFALRDDTLKQEGTGLVKNFPYFKAIGKAERPGEDESLTIDNMTDDSFSTTIFEVGKAVGATKRSFLSSAAKEAEIVDNMLSQMGRVLAEEVDKALNGEITSYDGDNSPDHAIGDDVTKYDNMTIGYLATQSTDVMNVQRFMIGRTRAFGDKANQTVVCFMHSTQLLDLMTDPTSGFLKADANDPYSYIQGFKGRILNTVIVEVDSVPKLPAKIDGRTAYLAHFHKVNSYGIMEKEDVEFDSDKDILARKTLWTATEWYGVKSFDRKINRLDQKAAGMITTASLDLAGDRA